jgi:UPF0755 protein
MHEANHLGVVLDSMDEAPQARRSHRHQDKERRRQRRRRSGKRGVVLLVALLVVGGGLFGAYTVLKPWVTQLTASNDYTGTGTGKVEVVVNPGDSGRAIGRSLEDAGVVKSSDAFVEAAANEPKAASIQPGTYTLKSHMSAAAALDLMLDPSSRTSERVLVREGLTAEQIADVLSKESGQPLSDYTKALKDADALGLPAAAKGRAEGWLFPDTYQFDTNATPAEQLAAMVTQMRSVLDDLGVSDDDAQKVLTKASIVQGEGARPEDFGKIARVIDNRLDQGIKLQMDSTVHYVVGKDKITTTKEQRETKSPYNTYAVEGLPPGPIGNPGKAAIEAVLHPTPGDWLYFVAVNPTTGETKFAATKAEHDQNVAEFRQWCRDNAGQC